MASETPEQAKERRDSVALAFMSSEVKKASGHSATSAELRAIAPGTLRVAHHMAEYGEKHGAQAEKERTAGLLRVCLEEFEIVAALYEERRPGGRCTAHGVLEMIRSHMKSEEA